MLHESRRRFLKTRRWIFSLLLQYLILVLPLTLLTAVLLFVFNYFEILTSLLAKVSFGLISIYLGVLTLRLIKGYFDNVYILGSLRIIIYTNLFNLKPKKLSINYQDIHDLKINLTKNSSFLDVADISITKSDGTEFIFYDIHKPHEFYNLVKSLISLPEASRVPLLKPTRLRKSRFKKIKKLERKKFFAAS